MEDTFSHYSRIADHYSRYMPGYVQQRAFSHSGEASAQIFFGLGPKPTLEQMQALAERYPVFRIEVE